MRELLEILGDLLLIGCGAVLIYIFFSIYFSGGYMAVEQNPLVLRTEMVTGIIIVIIGIGRFIDDARKH